MKLDREETNYLSKAFGHFFFQRNRQGAKVQVTSNNTVLLSELQFHHRQQFHQIISQYADHNHTDNSGHLFQNMTTIITSQRAGHHVTDNMKMVKSFYI